MAIEFITKLAWILGILSTLLTLYRFYCAVMYLKGNGVLADRLMKRPEKTFKSTGAILIAVICWTWIFTY